MLQLLKTCIALVSFCIITLSTKTLNGNESISTDTMTNIIVTSTSNVVEIEKQKEVIIYHYQLCNKSYVPLNSAIFGHTINESLDIEFSDANKGWSETSLNEIHYSMTQGLLPNTCSDISLRLFRNLEIDDVLKKEINPQIKRASFQKQWLFASL